MLKAFYKNIAILNKPGRECSGNVGCTMTRNENIGFDDRVDDFLHYVGSASGLSQRVR